MHPREEPIVTSARVAVFAHLPVTAAGLSDLLLGTDGVDIVGATTEVAELVSLVVERGARLVVTEVLHESENPTPVFDTIHSIERSIGEPVSVVCVIPSPAGFALDLTRRGATAVVTMTDEPETLRRAVADAVTPPAFVPSPVRDIDDEDRRPSLTARELEVLQGMVDGYSSRVIAANLGVSVNTIRTHVQRLLPKLGAHNRLRAAAVAIDLGLVTPSTTRLRPPVGC